MERPASVDIHCKSPKFRRKTKALPLFFCQVTVARCQLEELNLSWTAVTAAVVGFGRKRRVGFVYRWTDKQVSHLRNMYLKRFTMDRQSRCQTVKLKQRIDERYE